VANVLLVDDDPTTRETFERLLRYAGHDVLTAESGGQALDLMQRKAPDVALLDLMLLDMTALDVIRELRARGIGTPRVIMTGFGTIESAVNAMKLGAVDYLTKPLEAEDLERAVVCALAGRPEQVPAVIRADGMVRWAMSVACPIDAAHDPKHLVDWSRIRGVATGDPSDLVPDGRDSAEGVAGSCPRPAGGFARSLAGLVPKPTPGRGGPSDAQTPAGQRWPAARFRPPDARRVASGSILHH